ncbi:hypothetical protein CERSUDRAFT_83763 [Gelatoporia subvermispora B]|uniref:RNase III domain-containing protein n=1 Tax=Ceriporiopsis subvermispora (strain B) TaxID=914234 RepID=M2QX85_CERS8|nr:hypothetical protein CERSUDRAFT_83763 [Gelatoporia subvermispora B]
MVTAQRVAPASGARQAQPAPSPSQAATTSSTPYELEATTAELEAHMNGLFPPLNFPPKLAARMLTHSSHPDALYRHNARMSFIGRRVLQSYLFMFLQSSSALTPDYEFDFIADNALNTYVLGEFVAPRWDIGKVVRWTPVNINSVSTGPALRRDPSSLLTSLSSTQSQKSIGMYKVHGTTVEAVIGGVFHQHGGQVAHRFFHTRLLPHILLPGNKQGLHDAFHRDALGICEKMGGVNGPLVVSPAATRAAATA